MITSSTISEVIPICYSQQFQLTFTQSTQAPPTIPYELRAGLERTLLL